MFHINQVSIGSIFTDNASRTEKKSFLSFGGNRLYNANSGPFNVLIKICRRRSQKFVVLKNLWKSVLALEAFWRDVILIKFLFAL